MNAPSPSSAPDQPGPESCGFFRAEKIDGRWWLISPEGRRFLSKGVGAVRFEGDRIPGHNIAPFGVVNEAKYGSEAGWRAATERRFFEWGLNTLGAWSDSKISGAAEQQTCLAYMPILDIGAAFVAQNQPRAAWVRGIFPDVFGADFERFAFERVLAAVASQKEKRWLLGWFTDNELRWGPDWRGADELLTIFLAAPANEPGKRAAVELLRGRYAAIENFNEVWNTTFRAWEELAAADAVTPPVIREASPMQNQGVGGVANDTDPKRAAFAADCEAFVGRLAERYFDVTGRALKAADPNHLNCGCRFAYVPPGPVIAAAAKHLDVISFNCYEMDPGDVIRCYSAFGKPLIIGEFSFRGEDSGLPNTKGAGAWVKTQVDRAAAFERFVTTALSDPCVVGWHWFKFSDQPKEGRFDGENSNYGIVTMGDEVYEPVVATMRRVNQSAEEIHAASRWERNELIPE